MSEQALTDTPLLAKLHAVAREISHIEKRGRNDHHHYSYVQAVDVVRDIRELLLDAGVIVIPAAGNAQHLPYGSKGAHLTTVDLCYRLRDVDTGATIEVPWVGVGADTGGDKGVYKAYTGGLKYALLNLFLIPTSDDPERDQLTEQPEAHKDDQRPAAPRIPVDRAQTILERALNVGMAKMVDLEGGVERPDLHPVLQALLAQQGVEKIGLLNVDQAEVVEAFLVEEAKTK